MWVLSDSALLISDISGWWEVSPLILEHIVISCFFGMVTSWVGLFDYGNFQEKVKKAKPKKGPPTSTVDLFASDPCGFKGFVHKNNSHLAKGHSLPIMEPIDDFRTWFCASSEKCEVMQSLKAKL